MDNKRVTFQTCTALVVFFLVLLGIIISMAPKAELVTAEEGSSARHYAPQTIVEYRDTVQYVVRTVEVRVPIVIYYGLSCSAGNVTTDTVSMPAVFSTQEPESTEEPEEPAPTQEPTPTETPEPAPTETPEPTQEPVPSPTEDAIYCVLHKEEGQPDNKLGLPNYNSYLKHLDHGDISAVGCTKMGNNR